MKTLIYLMLLLPLLCFAQDDQQPQDGPLIIATSLIKPDMENFSTFKEAIKSHNEQFHSGGNHGARMFSIFNGPNAYNYMYVSGPMPWSAMDEIREDAEAHDTDWFENVIPYLKDETEVTIWRFDPKSSHFPPNFEMDKLQVMTFDIKRGEYENMKDHVTKMTDVLKEKYSDLPVGIYENEFSSTKDGKDLSVVYFFDDFAWKGEDHQWEERYNEVHGEGGYEEFMQGWKDLSNGYQTEIWIYDQELSGIGPQVTTSTED